MKTKQSVRRLVALTLATAVTIPQASPAFAASPELGKTGQIRLAEIKLSTAANSKWRWSEETGFPQLTLSRELRQKISAVTTVAKPVPVPSKTEETKEADRDQMGSDLPQTMVTNSNNKLQTSIAVSEDKTGTTDLATVIDEGEKRQLVLPRIDLGMEGPPIVSVVEKTSVKPDGDKRETIGAEEITDVTSDGLNEGNDPLFGDVVMPPEAGKLSLGSTDGTPPSALLSAADMAQGPDYGILEDEIGTSEGTVPAGGEGTADEEGQQSPLPDFPPPDTGGTPGEGSGETPETGGDPPVETGLPEAEEGLGEGTVQPPQADGLPGAEPEALEEGALLSLERAAADQTYSYSIGYGVPIAGDTGSGYIRLKDYGTTVHESSGNRQSYQFQVELPESVNNDEYCNRYGANVYVEGIYDVSWTEKYELIAQDDDSRQSTYAVFPSADMLGRIPDKTFDGWYIYPQGAKPGTYGTHETEDVKKWVFGDAAVDMGTVELSPYTSEDPGYIFDPDASSGYEEYGDNCKLGSLWDRGRSYSEFGYKTVQEDRMTSPVSFVGRWRASDESRAADVAIVQDETIDMGDEERLPSVEYSKLDSAVTLTAGGQKLQLYTGDIVGKYGDELKKLETTTGFDRGEIGAGTEYWLRVPANVNSLDLVFNAAEIFFDYNSQENKSGVVSPVKILWRQGGEQIDYTEGTVENSTFTSKMYPSEWFDSSWNYVPANRWDNPAYSRWSVTNIALLPSGAGTGQEGYRYNDISIVVSPPSVYEKELRGEALTAEDEAKITTYTFHVQRLTEPTLTQSPGNTPLGMIARDTGGETEFHRDVAREKFEAELKFSNEYAEYPRSQVNNGGTIFRDRYTPKAWDVDGGQKLANVDLDPEAIVVYQNSAFLDPGISLTDAEGRPVAIGVDNPWIVYRRLKLRTADELSIANLTKGQACWYRGGQLVDEEGNALPRLQDVPGGEVLSSGTDQIDLRGLKVLPGIYRIEYEIYDPVADETYGWDASKGWVVDPGKAAGFTRTLVVLPLPGDVDMDGAVTSADAEVLRRYLTNATVNGETEIPPRLGDTYLGSDPTVDLFAYRVANMDHDDTLDKHRENSDKVTDADLLEALPRTQLNDRVNNRSDYYYLPLPNTVEAVQRKTLETNPNAEGPKLELVYLGKEGSRKIDAEHKDGYFENPLGPWKNNGQKSTEKMELFDTMWVGVKLTGTNELLGGKGVNTFTFSLVYDARYLEPASVLTAGQWKDSAEERWKTTLQLYNTGSGSSTVWGRDNAYDFTLATQSGRNFTTYDSKVITPLEEAAAKEGRNTHLKELVFSVTLTNKERDGIRLDGTGDQWLLAAPFNMIQHPLGIEEGKGYQGVEMQAGMSDFTLVFQDGDNLATAAYNPLVKDIFGGKTENLATCVTYANAGPEVPLGTDRSEVLYIRNEPYQSSTSDATDVVYSSDFKSMFGWKKNPDGTWADEVIPIPRGAIVRYAPEWLEYNNIGAISGKPEAAGTYYFTIANYRYQLDVAQAPLHYWADSQRSYYGEEEFRGENSPDFTFHYRQEEIKSIELERVEKSGGTISADGRGEGLEALLADERYTPPQFTAVDKNGAAVSYRTVVSNGAYEILSTLAMSSNYELIYETEQGDGGRGLMILPRPLRVTEFAAKNVGQIFSDQSGSIFNLTARLNNGTGGAKDFSVALARPLDTDEAGHYDGLPLGSHEGYEGGVLLPGDSLELRYQAELLQNPEDIAQSTQGGNRYALKEARETRVAHISGLRIMGGTNSECYTIGSQMVPETNDKEDVVGWVRRRSVKGFRIVEVPDLEYATGDQLRDCTALHFYIEKESDGEEVLAGTYPYNEETTLSQHGVKVTWATPKEKEDGVPGKLEYHDRQVFTMEYNGCYLCLSTDNGIGGTIVSYYDVPLRITPRSLVLTAVESGRFYGEKNGELKFTYDPASLSVGDLETLRQLYGENAANGGPRDGAELVEILGTEFYTPPKLSVLSRVSKEAETGNAVKGEPLNERSNAGPTTYVVFIEGAESKNYQIQYSYTYTDSDGTRKTITQDKWGAVPFRIQPRPIVVEALRDTGATQNLVTLYADTKRIFKTGLPLALEDLVIELPEHDADSTRYYRRYGAASMTTLEMSFAQETPILEGDTLAFRYRATVASQDGADYVHWTSFSKGHFDMAAANANGNRIYPVQVEELALVTEGYPAAGNYELVYRDPTSATLGIPAQWEAVTGCINPGVNNRMDYYVPWIMRESGGTLVKDHTGQGTVTLRPIEEIRILSAGKVQYTYGETYAPNQPQEGQRLGLQIHIEYKREPEDELAKNVTSGEVEFQITRYTDENGVRVPVTTFDERGLKIYYQPGGETTDVASCRELSYQDLLDCATHNGKHLVVAGKRGSQKELVWSVPSEEHLTVEPRSITLRAVDQHRVYGEDNPVSFPFTFDARELAPQDQIRLGVGSGSFDGSRLGGLGLDYSAPVFATDAERKSAVRDGGRSGYEIQADRQGSLDNYELRYEPGTLYIYPRKVQIDRFHKDPIYTIYSDVNDNIVHDNLFVDDKRTEFSLKIPAGQYRPEGAPGPLPMTGSALVGGDAMTLWIELSYPPDWREQNGRDGLAVTVTDAQLQAGMAGYGNYVLETTGDGKAVIEEAARKATGYVKLRRITSIKIQRAPWKTEYTYGETLNLDGLVVNISYEEESGGTVDDVTIPYEYTDQFNAQGLYVHYYPYPEIQDVDNLNVAAWANLRTKYYTAATGDHVTIAPTHASMDAEVPLTIVDNDGVERDNPKREFAANGQYLVVTAQRKSQYGDEQIPAEPVLVRKDNGELVQIKVNPRPLEFRLEADEKVYDGTTEATGTLGLLEDNNTSLHSVFRQAGQVDYYNKDVTDMVFPVTGADYEDVWGAKLTPEGDQDFSDYVTRNGYNFTTGAEGYRYGAEGTMTFSFLDPNVAYVTEPTVHDVYGPLTTKSVQVKGLRLAGADAANYELRVREVTPDNVAKAGSEGGYLGSELPKATIRKAERAPMSLEVLPTVEVDPNTNVVRILYDQPISAIKGVEGAASNEEPAYEKELHFEYALQYVDTQAPETEGQEATYVVEQLAGEKGELLWWDERFYGGETVSLEYPEGYVPREEDIPTGEDVSEDTLRKGQVYAWAQEDPGFVLDDEAYPGGAAWPGYELYRTERTALKRSQVYWPVVRVAETHNYKASPAISSVGEYDGLRIQAVLDALAALKNAQGNQDQLDKAQEYMNRVAEAVMNTLAQAREDAVAAAQAESALLSEIAEGGKWPEEGVRRAPGAAVSTYAQRLELVSLEEMEGQEPPAPDPGEPEPPETGARAAGGGAEDKFLVPTLEAVWFTDIQEYEDKKLLDAVARNLSPVRYQDYAWDGEQSAPLFSDDKEPLSLLEPFQVTITREDEQGGEITEEITVNEDNSARIYVELRSNSGGSMLVPVESIRIDSDDLMVKIGADPVWLKVILTPENVTNRDVRWSSSDESVATVDRNGKVIFVGVGTAVITATSVDGPSDSITVTVRGEQSWLDDFPNSIFNMDMQEPFFRLEEGAALFHPQWEMTRGEAAQLLTKFYMANPNWTRTGPQDFPDLTGEESYAASARLLGSLGVFQGLPDGRFGGEKSISRAEFVVLLTRMVGIDTPDTAGQPHAFLDTGEEDTWAYREIDAIKAVPGVVLGTGEGYFSPDRPITRAESAVFLTRMLQFPLVGENPVVPKDVGESHWARGPILRAVNQGHPLEETGEQTENK